MTDRPAFEAPWQARTFALATALREAGHLSWSASPEVLAEQETAGADEYYERWIAALEFFAAGTEPRR